MSKDNVSQKAKKIGRPLSSPLPRQEKVDFRLNKIEYQALNEHCWRYDISVSDCIRDLLMIHSVIPDNPIQ